MDTWNVSPRRPR